MLGFGKTHRDPFADIKAAERWLEAFPANDPLMLHSALLTELARYAEPETRRTPTRLAAVLHVDAKTEALRQSLNTQYLEHSSRSGQIENQLWQALFDLSQTFLVCYQAFSRDASGVSSRW